MGGEGGDKGKREGEGYGAKCKDERGRGGAQVPSFPHAHRHTCSFTAHAHTPHT